MTVQDISQRAKKIRAQYPNKKWTDCIKQASKELKSGKVGAVKKSGVKYAKDTRKGKLYVNMSNTFGKITDTTINLLNSTKLLHKDSKGVYYYVASKGKDAGYVKYTKVYEKKIGATKSAPANQTRVKQRTKKPVSKHKDLMSHNVRINVLSGLGGKPTPLVLNGVSRVTRGSYYLLQYPDGEVSNKAIFKYLKKLKTGELVFDVYQKGKSGAFNKPIQYQFPPSALLSLVKTKKPTAKELSIGHLKLLK